MNEFNLKIIIITEIIVFIIMTGIFKVCKKYGKKIIYGIKSLIKKMWKINEKNKITTEFFGWGFIVLFFYYMFIFSDLDIDKKNNTNFWYRMISVFNKENAENIYNNFVNKMYDLKYVGLLYIVLLFVNGIINKIINIFINNKIKNKMKNLNTDVSELYNSLYSYLNDKNDKNPILIVGKWGAGKTYTLNYFFENYFNKREKRKIYNISCFGIENKEVLLSAIKNICEKEDTSLYKSFIDIIGKLPVIGEFLGKILQKDYELNNIKENSIFVFDNFERVAPNKEGEYDVLVKYNIVSGIIDELIEKYNMKVIILANEEKVIDNYISDCFINKLSCRRFEIKTDIHIIEDVWKRIINNIGDLNNKEELNRIFEEHKDTIINIWKYKSDNIRILQHVFYEFIVFIKNIMDQGIVFEKNKMDEKVGILYTLLIIKLYKGESFIKKIENGECIGQAAERINVYYTNLQYGGYECEEKIELIKNINAKWYGKDIEDWLNIVQNSQKILKNIMEVRNNKLENLTKFDYLKIPDNSQMYDFKNLIITNVILGNSFNDIFRTILEKCSIKFGNVKTLEEKKNYIQNIFMEYHLYDYFNDNVEFVAKPIANRIIREFGGKDLIDKIPMDKEFRDLLHLVK